MHPRDYTAFTKPIPTLPLEGWEEETAHSLQGSVRRGPGLQAPPLQQSAPSGLIRTQQALALQQLRIPAAPGYARSDGGVVLDRVLTTVGGRSWWLAVSARYRIQRWVRQVRGEADVAAAARMATDPDNTALGAHFRWAMTRRSVLAVKAEVPTVTRLPLPDKDLPEELNELSRRPPSLQASLRRSGPAHAASALLALNAETLGEGGGYKPHARLAALQWGTRDDLPAGARGVCESVADEAAPLLRFVQAGAAWDLRGAWRPRKRAYELKMAKRLAKEAAEQGSSSDGSDKESTSRALPLPSKDIGKRRGFSMFLSEPKFTVAASVGALAQLWKSGPEQPTLSAVPLASLSATGQLGRFMWPLLDYTEIGARLDLGVPKNGASLERLREQARPLAGGADPEAAAERPIPSVTSVWESMKAKPLLTLSLSQQVIGPLRARADVQIDPLSVDLSNGPQEAIRRAEPLQVIYGGDCMIPGLRGTARLAAWYSPQRQEGMMEVRMF
eukprot:CAMPEP_0177624070 /NCGR_PEP_ID=MMETSP0419_2-20121207/29273_1 /TAXON_ID=582737 /ORGANISM="Tetraselmis sp., Strain GSL018" /LENGTH=501 /DNA_ID=CAMNT_0019124731 /DNA_START=73 /DNA_END=1579 /DNA_ORIENTATION=-